MSKYVHPFCFIGPFNAAYIDLHKQLPYNIFLYDKNIVKFT